jgi:hypothetical protein
VFNPQSQSGPLHEIENHERATNLENHPVVCIVKATPPDHNLELALQPGEIVFNDDTG